MDALHRIGVIPDDDPETVLDTDDQYRKAFSPEEEGTEVIIERVW